MHNKTKFNIISFYEFINLTEIEQLKSELIHFLKKEMPKELFCWQKRVLTEQFQ